MKVYKRIGESMNRTSKKNQILPNVGGGGDRLNTGNGEKSLLKSGMASKNMYEMIQRGMPY